jgi:porin
MIAVICFCIRSERTFMNGKDGIMERVRGCDLRAKIAGIVVAGLIWAAAAVCEAAAGELAGGVDSGGGGIGEYFDVALNATQIYQQNVRGGMSTHRRAGRYSGSYDVEVTADMEKMLGLTGGRVYSHMEGGWSKSAGVDGPSVGSMFGVNGDAFGRYAAVVTELFYEQVFGDREFIMHIGKMDPTGGFHCRGCPVAMDTNRYANDETSQFLNGALVNNPTISVPDYALGVAAFWNPVEWWYVSGAVLDAENDFRETGFRTAFGGEDFYFYTLETGIVPDVSSGKGPMTGTYRAGMWVDGQDKARFSDGKNYRDDVGFYVSCDQMLYKENVGCEDQQGLGAFVRYGWADSNLNDITNFVSGGLQYRGLLEGRDDDVIGVGAAHGVLSDQKGANGGAGFTEDYEQVWEVYYNAAAADWMRVSPSLQYVRNPGGDRSARDAVVFGVRVQMTF